MNNANVYFFDSRVTEWQTLTSQLPAGSLWFELSADQNGVEQIRQALAGLSGITALHLFSHGSAGRVQLGASELSGQNLAEHSQELGEIGRRMEPGGEILVYGCSVASGEPGQDFIQQLAALTGTDVAASVDLTGAAGLGGNWVLEASAGPVQTAALSPDGFATLLANSAPVLSADGPVLAGMTEDAVGGAGQTVASILGNSLSDVDAGALQGIALSGVTGSYGKWQYSKYSTSAISPWVDVGTVSESSALLLRGADLLRWLPDGSNGTTATFSYYGWDQTTGSVGGKVSVATRGATTAFSTAGDVASLSVASAADAPRLVSAIADQAVTEDLAFSFTVPAGTFVEVDAGDSIGYLASLSNGDPLPMWMSFDAATVTFSGTPTNADVGFLDVIVTAYDGSFLTTSDTFRLTIQNVNDAPVLTAASPALRSITEDDTANAGQTVASFLGSSLSDVDAGALQGIALRAVTGSAGKWQYITSAGSTWADVGTVSETSALLLRSTDLLRWLPDGTFGTTATLTYHGWDQTAGSAGSKGSVATRGGTTAYSSATDSAVLNVQSVNDAPEFLVGDGDGTVITDIGNYIDAGYSTTLQPDGKILVAGYSRTVDFYGRIFTDFALVRYNANGTLDITFDGDGKVTTDIAGSDFGQSIALQSDGKVLVAGSSNAFVALVRYNTNGSLDTTFDSDGKVTTDLATGYEYGRSVTVQPDGKILVAGESNRDFALIRYNTDGSLDTTFDGDGKLTTNIAGFSSEAGYSVALQPDGKILVAGNSSNGSGGNPEFALVRYNANGSLDTTFDVDGKVTTAIRTREDLGYSVTLQSDGKILVAGSSNNDLGYPDYVSFPDFALVRYNTNGSLDTTFDGDGKVTTAIGAGEDVGLSVALQPDGKILVAGYNYNKDARTDFALVRYNANGSLDTTFNGDGKVTTNIRPGNDYGQSVTLQPDGKILVAGSSNNDFVALVRYNTNGSLDTSFGSTNSLALVEDGPATLLNTAMRVTDLELNAQGHCAGATLTLARRGGASAEDVFSSGVAALGALTQGGALTVSSTTIGTVTQNSAGTLVLSFDASATQILVNAALQGIAYRTTSQAPPASLDLNWVFSDGNTGAQGSGGALVATGSTTVTITAVNDAPTGSLTITGTPTQGQVLTAGSLADPDGIPMSGSGAVAYQWMADGVAIPGATSSTLTLKQAQVGMDISVTARYTDLGGTAESVTSAATAAVANLNDPPVGLVTITGTPAQGQTLSAANTLTDADGIPTSGAGAISYQWRADGVAISGATTGTFTLNQAQVGKAISVTARYTDNLGAPETVTSSATSAVANLNDAPTGAVSIAGNASHRHSLSATNTLADVDGIPGSGAGSISYQWRANGSPISGATGSTFSPTPTQIGKVITVTASYTDLGGAVESITSPATEPIRGFRDFWHDAVTRGMERPNPQALPFGQDLMMADTSYSTDLARLFGVPLEFGS